MTESNITAANAGPWVGGVAVAAGVAALFSEARPTGTLVADQLILGCVVAAVVWASSRTHWAIPTAAAALGALLGVAILPIALGMAGFVLGLWFGRAGQYLHFRVPHRAAVATASAFAVNSLARAETSPLAGATTLIAAGISVALVWTSVRTSPVVRRVLVRVAVGTCVFAIVAAALVAVAIGGVGDGARDANTTATAASAALDQGDYELAADLFSQASLDFRRVDERIDSPLVWPSRIVPGLSQNVNAGARLAAAGADMAEQASMSLRQVDPNELTVSGGAIDLDAIRSIVGPLTDVQTAFQRLGVAIDDSDSPWLFPPVARQVTRLADEFEEQAPRLDNVVGAARLLPQMLGGDDARRYLVLFTTPAEARGLGGFPGSVTTIEIDNGAVTVGDVGRIADLNAASIGTECSGCNEAMLARYGRFGLTIFDGLVGDDMWSNITIPANFPDVADAADRIYPQATGVDIDGVIVMDPFVVQAFAAYGGAIEVPQLALLGLPTSVEPGDVAEFILRDQYLLQDSGERIPALGALAAGSLSAILDGDLPDPPTVLNDLAPLVAERRLLAWTDDSTEQALLDNVGLLGSLPAIDPQDGGFSVAVTNGSGSKIDVFLEREVEVREVFVDGQRRLSASVTLRNTAPTSGLPEYVIGNVIGLPTGTSRLIVTFYGPPGLASTALDGEPIEVSAWVEAGWRAHETRLDLAPGESRQFVVEFDLPSGGGSFEPVVWEQPLAQRGTSE